MKEVKYQGLCAKLILELKSKGISDNKVLEAISNTPRHLLFDPVFRDKFVIKILHFQLVQIKQ